jgi:dTDP-4-dehydrorhamnose 3,5-epimerase
VDDADIFYFVSAPYTPSHQRGVRWDDPAFGIAWPLGPPSVIHPRDAGYADYARVR